MRLKPIADESRYARHDLIDWWDQERLRRSRVLVAGAGAIGNEVIKLLALLGVGQIVIVDLDTVTFSNLSRSVLFRAEDVGRSKAEIAADRARQINPDITVEAISGDLEYDVGLGIYRAMDVIIGCLDSVQARLALNRACYRAGVPWLNGGIEATIAEVAFFGSDQGTCFECGMSNEMWQRRNLRYSCGGLQDDSPETKMPTTAIVASVTAGYLVNEALFLLHADRPALKQGLAVSQKIYLTLKPYSFGVYDLPLNSQCLAHDRWEPVEVLSHSPRDLSAMELLEIAAMPDGAVELGFDLLTEMRCVQCEQSDTVLEPVEKCSIALLRCECCQTDSRQPQVIHWLDATSEYASRPLRELGITEHQVLVAKNSVARRFFQLSGEYHLDAKKR